MAHARHEFPKGISFCRFARLKVKEFKYDKRSRVNFFDSIDSFTITFGAPLVWLCVEVSWFPYGTCIVLLKTWRKLEAIDVAEESESQYDSSHQVLVKAMNDALEEKRRIV